MEEKRVGMTVGTMTRLTNSGIDLTACVTEALNKVVQDAFRDAIKQNLERAFVGVLTPVRTRTVTRQSCLWRHSFDWRNRKRGHPTHR